ncbi:MAG: 2-C-methyl-D-erythritol 4-phosphate cytidylyltransferase [Planctomycetota bacterium]|nr:2-C-methyl-D-erythritol 4-phosphate cytidylyltransferase [Planctomycetota bacterium]
MHLAILLLASGRGTRMGGATPKVYLPVAGVPILLRTARRLAQLDPQAEIVLAVNPEDRSTHLAPLLPELSALGIEKVIDGGATRQDSMMQALAAAGQDCDTILIHDAARPFFPIEATRQAIARAAEVGAALLAIPTPDTLKQVNDARQVEGTLDRAGVWLAQTPQIVRRNLLEQGLAVGHTGTDDVSLVEQLGQPVEVVNGSARNLKITAPSDLELAEFIATLEDPT